MYIRKPLVKIIRQQDFQELPAFQKRMIVEYYELNNRYERLVSTIDSVSFDYFSPSERKDLREQREAMSNYLACLKRRMNRINLLHFLND